MLSFHVVFRTETRVFEELAIVLLVTQRGPCFPSEVLDNFIQQVVSESVIEQTALKGLCQRMLSISLIWL